MKNHLDTKFEITRFVTGHLQAAVADTISHATAGDLYSGFVHHIDVSLKGPLADPNTIYSVFANTVKNVLHDKPAGGTFMWTRFPCETGQHIASCSFVYLPPPPADPRDALLAEADRFMQHLFRSDLEVPLSSFMPTSLYKDALRLYGRLAKHHERPDPQAVKERYQKAKPCITRSE